MTLSDDLGAATSKAVVLEAALAEAGLEIARLTVELAECQDAPSPTPIPPVPVPPGPQPPDGHYVSLADDVNAAIRQHPAGSTFVLEPGNRNLAEPLVRKAGNVVWSVGAMFTGEGAGGYPFLPVDVAGLTLLGIGAKYFGPATTDQGSGMVDFEGGVDLYLEGCDFGYSNRSAVSGHGSWTMIDTHLHHCGKYAAQGAFKLIRDCEWSYCGVNSSGVTGWTESQDRGGCKFVKSKGMRVEGLYTHHHGGTGLWWDIQNENIYAEDVVSEDNARHGISIEVSYGPAELVNPIVRRCGTIKRSGETDVPVPAGILVSMSPNVTVTDATVEDCWNGLIVRQWKHPQVIGTIGNADKSRLGVENVIFQGGRVTRSKQFDAGLHGSHVDGTRPTRNIHWNDVVFDDNASTCSPLHVG